MEEEKSPQGIDALEKQLRDELRVKPKDTRFKGYSSKFESDVMLYLRNLAMWKHSVGTHLDVIQERLNEQDVMLVQLGQKIERLGRANCEAYGQVKVVMERLADVTEETRCNLDEYGGIITESTYDNVRLNVRTV